MKDFLAQEFPGSRTRSGELRLLAVDLETTGLDARTDRLLTIGFVPVDGEQVVLSGARHLICAQSCEVGQSAAVHGVTDDALAAGVPMRAALTELLDALAGRVLLAHHASIEESFLAAACREEFGAEPVFTTVDTWQLQARVRRVDPDAPPPGVLRLGQARDHFGLPRYRSHQALTDALACAELYLAQVAALGDGDGLTLGRLQARVEHSAGHGGG